MIQQWKYHSQRAFRSCRTSWEVENQALTGNATDSTSKSGKGSLLRSILPNQLRKSRNKTVADRERSFWSNVASSKTSSARSDPTRRSEFRQNTGRSP